MQEKNQHPPRWADRFLEWFCKDQHLEVIQGDLYELFYDRLENMPPWQARFYFIRDVLDMIRPFALRGLIPYNLIYPITMFKNYLKTAFRGLIRRKSYALINIFGLSLGISVCLILYLTIRTELEYDAFHSKAERIVRITQIFERDAGLFYQPYMPYPAARALRQDFPEWEKVTQIHTNGGGTIQAGNKKIVLSRVVFADEYFLDVFDFKLLQGNRQNALKEPNTVVLSQSSAQKIFGDEPAIGKLIKLDDMLSLKVTGIIKDPPRASHLPYSMLVSYTSFTNDYFPLDLDIFSEWDFTDHGSVYALLQSGKKAENYAQELDQFKNKYYEKDIAQILEIYPQALRDIHFDMRFAERNLGRTISQGTLWTYGGLGFFILLVACINFINLSTAQASLKNREVGIRKVMGAKRGQLITQFLTEAFLLTGIALSFALGLIYVILPKASQLVGLPLYLNLLTDFHLWAFVLFTFVTVSLLAGFYPAFLLSSYQPIVSLRSLAPSGSPSNRFLRRSLVVFQFFITQVLIIGTLVAYQQMNHFRSKDLGYQPEAVVMSHLPFSRDSIQSVRLKERLLAHPQIAQVSLNSSPASNNITLSGGFQGIGDDPDNWQSVQFRAADQDYLATYSMQLLAGKNILDQKKAIPDIIVNETLLRKIGIQNPEEALGKELATTLGINRARIVGVVKDFHNLSLQNQITPCIIAYLPENFWNFSVRLHPKQDIPALIADMENTYNQLFPNEVFEYYFEDDRLARYYREEERLMQTFQVFALIAILIGSFGLFGLISFIALQKTKEIGIRKVLGASVNHIVRLISGEFLKLLLISFTLAAPLAYVLMQHWLEDFAYRIQIQAWVFVLAAGISLLITCFTIAYQTLKTAFLNPVEALHYE